MPQRRKATTKEDKYTLRMLIVKELNFRNGTHMTMDTPNTELMNLYNSMKKSEKNGFFNEAAAKLKRPNERVFQMFMNLMKDDMYTHKLTPIESISIHNFAFVNRFKMSVNEIRDELLNTIFRDKNVNKNQIYTIAYKACMDQAHWRPLPLTDFNMT